MSVTQYKLYFYSNYYEEEKDEIDRTMRFQSDHINSSHPEIHTLRNIIKAICIFVQLVVFFIATPLKKKKKKYCIYINGNLCWRISREEKTDLFYTLSEAQSVLVRMQNLYKVFKMSNEAKVNNWSQHIVRLERMGRHLLWNLTNGTYSIKLFYRVSGVFRKKSWKTEIVRF